MQWTNDNEGNGSLEGMWEEHRPFLRRLLIGLSRDIDLADDLLQETYIKAGEGMAEYRGGDARAWLAAIARNAFYSHCRRRYVRSETQFLDDADMADDSMAHHAGVIDVRAAVANLSDALRSALIMKHFGGYTYEEIASRLDCPVGTAKRRVSVALSKLRVALSEGETRFAEMKCSELTDRPLLDYVYGKLTEHEMQTVDRHLADCSACRETMKEITRVLHALDGAGRDFKVSSLIEINEAGVTTSYMVLTLRSGPVVSGDAIQIQAGAGAMKYAFVDGEEARVAPGDNPESFWLHLSKPIQPNQATEMLFISETAPNVGLERLEDGTIRLGPGKLIMTEDFVYLVAVRLPASAILVKATPEPSRIRSNGATTVEWRNALPANQESEFWIDYRLPQTAES